MKYPHQIEKAYEEHVRSVLEAIAKSGEPYIEEAGREDHTDAAPTSWERSMAHMRNAQKKILDEGSGNALALIQGFGAGIEKWDLREWQRQLKPFTGADMYPPGDGVAQQATEQWAKDNLERIKTLSTEQIEAMNKTVKDAVSKGLSMRDIRKAVEGEKEKYTGWRAELLARDQTGKLNGALTQSRSVAAGVSKYSWRGALDQRERPQHRHLEGQLRVWGEGIIPGEEILCRCTSEPELDDIWTKCEQEVYGKNVTPPAAPAIPPPQPRPDVPKPTVPAMVPTPVTRKPRKLPQVPEKPFTLKVSPTGGAPDPRNTLSAKKAAEEMAAASKAAKGAEKMIALAKEREELLISVRGKAGMVSAKAQARLNEVEAQIVKAGGELPQKFTSDKKAAEWNAKSWDNAPEWLKKALYRADSRLGYASERGKGSYYQKAERQINMAKGATQDTWRHEFGHHLDYCMNERNSMTYWSTQHEAALTAEEAAWKPRTAFAKQPAPEWTWKVADAHAESLGAFKDGQDLNEFMAKHFGGGKFIHVQDATAALFDGSPSEFYRRWAGKYQELGFVKHDVEAANAMAHGSRVASQFMDMLEASSKGNYGYGHGAKYFSNYGNRMAEMSAQFTSLVTSPDGAKWEAIIKRFWPNVYASWKESVISFGKVH